jgi:DNA-binding CsgD family transcriptional regulator
LADVINPGDRALIDAHLAAHGAPRIATGVSGYVPGAPPPPPKTGWGLFHYRRAEKLAKRRDEVVRRINAGHTYAVIARAFGVSEATIHHDVKALKNQGKLPRASTRHPTLRKGNPGVRRSYHRAGA